MDEFKDVAEGRAKSDSTLVVRVGSETSRLVNCEFKNDLAGLTSDPNIQNIGYWIPVRETCCPLRGLTSPCNGSEYTGQDRCVLGREVNLPYTLSSGV